MNIVAFILFYLFILLWEGFPNWVVQRTNEVQDVTSWENLTRDLVLTSSTIHQAVVSRVIGMRDTINILLECDLRQAEVSVLVKILQEEPRLLVKLVKQAIVREVEEAGTLILALSLPPLFLIYVHHHTYLHLMLFLRLYSNHIFCTTLIFTTLQLYYQTCIHSLLLLYLTCTIPLLSCFSLSLPPSSLIIS